jgi:hypothetical protein
MASSVAEQEPHLREEKSSGGIIWARHPPIGGYLQQQCTGTECIGF